MGHYLHRWLTLLSRYIRVVLHIHIRISVHMLIRPGPISAHRSVGEEQVLEAHHTHMHMHMQREVKTVVVVQFVLTTRQISWATT